MRLKIGDQQSETPALISIISLNSILNNLLDNFFPFRILYLLNINSPWSNHRDKIYRGKISFEDHFDME